MWGIIPAAGIGSRIQPLAFSKELLPLGSWMDGTVERPRAVSEHLIQRMCIGGVDKICIVISPGKSDIMEYYGSRIDGVHICYAVQQKPLGLCDAIFSVLPFISNDETVLIGLPDTIWFPENGYNHLSNNELSFLLFPVEHPEFFDAVLIDDKNYVQKIKVKEPIVETDLIWGAFKMPKKILQQLYDLWLKRNREDEYFGTLTNAFIKEGGMAKGIPAGQSYIDVGTINGYKEAMALLDKRKEEIFKTYI